MTDGAVQPAARTGAWSSSLSTNDYAACVASGLRPLGFVQGCSVVSWNFIGRARAYGIGGYGSGFEQYSCPHGMVSAEHRMYGVNYEKIWIEDAWMEAFRRGLERLLHEAANLGAHGVIGVIERRVHHRETSTFEMTLSGTAVGFEGVERPDTPFTTFLAGQKLSKLVEAGFAPVSIVLSFVAVGVYASCITESQLSGAGGMMWTPSGEIEQVTRAEESARRFVRERVRDQLGGDTLHGARLVAHQYETAEGPQIDVTMWGNRVRRFRDFEALPPPRPVVRLVDR